MKSTLAIVTAAIIGLVSMVLVYSYLQTAQSKLEEFQSGVSVAVPTANLPAGRKLTKEDITTATVPERFVSTDAVRENEISMIIGRTLLRQAKKGELLLASHVRADFGVASVEDKISPGKRAVTIPVDQVTGLARMIKPGQYVDVIVTFDIQLKHLGEKGTLQTEKTTKTYTLLQNKPVLAVDESGFVPDEDSSLETHQDIRYGTVTLEVSPQEAEKLAFAHRKGGFHLTLRNRQDPAGSGSVKPVDMESIVKEFEAGS